MDESVWLDADELDESIELSFSLLIDKSLLFHKELTKYMVGTHDESVVMDCLISWHQDCMVNKINSTCC